MAAINRRYVSKVYISVDRREIDGALQISIGDDAVSYRIAGPKYDGRGQTLIRHFLSARDCDEIRSYLRRIEQE